MGEFKPSQNGTVVRAGEARQRGLTRHKLEQSVGRRQTRGMYVIGNGPVELGMRAKAVLTGCGKGAVVSHFTAAELLGGWVPDRAHIHVTIPASRRVRRPEVVIHRTTRSLRVTRAGGLAVTDAVQTFLDLAGHLDLIDLVALGDSFVKGKLTTAKELIAEAASWRGCGVARARQAARLVRANVDSRRETWLRLLIVLAGLPEPTIDHRIYGPNGELLRRVDLAYENVKLGMEYDGRQHAESDTQWSNDIDRREYFDGEGWRLVIVIVKHFYADPGKVLDRIVAAARAQGMTIPDPEPAWRQYFHLRRGV